jgi:murein hydrolase activator
MRYTSLFLFLLCSTFLSYGQQPTRNDLEKRRQVIVDELKETQAQLEATKKDHKATVSQLHALQAKLNARERLIGNINQEISHLDEDIRSSSNDVMYLQSNLKTLQERYAQSVRYAYSNRSSYNMLTFIFSARDFNDALRRMKYMRKYRDFRKNQVADIKQTQGKIEHKIGVLSSVKSQKGLLLTAEEQQKLAIQAERNETNKVVTELKGREQELVGELEQKRKVARRLDNAISDAIRREIEIARKKAEEEERRRKVEEDRKAAALAAAAKANPANSGNTYGSGANKVILSTGGRNDPPSAPAASRSTAGTAKPGAGAANNPKTTGSTPPAYNPVAATVDHSRPAASRNKPSYTPVTTPETSELSRNFESNRGRLPWPVERGVITDQFGKHKHAVATRVEIENNGIDIQTSTGARARAVFDGKVTTIIPMAGVGQTVLIQHGTYFTVYARLASVTVSVGQTVSTKDVIGTVSNNEDGVAVMNFQIWKSQQKLNPTSWIMPM